MRSVEVSTNYNWLCKGDDIFPAMLEAIDSAQKSVCLETYKFGVGSLGERFRDALARAAQRGARVRVLVDGLGSIGLPRAFLEPVRAAGGEVRVFNPLAVNRLGIRNHRKVLVCDERVAFVGGFNIASEYEGDGVKCGWCDLGLRLEGPLAAQLARTFDDMFARAEFRHKRFIRFRNIGAKQKLANENEQILLSGPGRGRSPIKRALKKDWARATNVQIIVAYFLPTWRMRRALTRVVAGGGCVQFILAGKSDVALSQLAGRSLYRRFLKAGVEIYEYQPQILHAKLIVVDDVVYVGSANLDQRSLNINYELMVRIQSREIAEQARAVFANNLKHCVRISPEQWRKSRTFWQRFKERLAYWLLVRMDPWIARWQWRGLPD
jgi:cardiolipin synthase